MNRDYGNNQKDFKMNFYVNEYREILDPLQGDREINGITKN